MINLNGKIFTTENTISPTVFLFHQSESSIWGEYHGGGLQEGTLTGTISSDGEIQFLYMHKEQQNGELKTGIGFSKSQELSDGRIRLSNSWQWTTHASLTEESSLIEVLNA